MGLMQYKTKTAAQPASEQLALPAAEGITEAAKAQKATEQVLQESLRLRKSEGGYVIDIKTPASGIELSYDTESHRFSKSVNSPAQTMRVPIKNLSTDINSPLGEFKRIKGPQPDEYSVEQFYLPKWDLERVEGPNTPDSAAGSYFRLSFEAGPKLKELRLDIGQRQYNISKKQLEEASVLGSTVKPSGAEK
jgi:hypothetical protein